MIGGLPLAFAAMAQSVIVISGGIDLSLGVMVAVINVLAASLMEGQSFAHGAADRVRADARRRR